MHLPTPHAAFPGALWPAVPQTQAAALLALVEQLSRSQFLPEEELAAVRRPQVESLLDHAWAEVPFWRERLTAAGLDPESRRRTSPDMADWNRRWSSLPILKRADVQSLGSLLHARQLPTGHGGVGETVTSGSSGRPVRIVRSTLAYFYWQAFQVREHLWRGRDLSGCFLSILRDERRTKLDDSIHLRRNQDWGAPVATVWPTGPSLLLDYRAPISALIQTLRDVAPDYVCTFPSLLFEILRRVRQEGTSLPRLREAVVVGEASPPELSGLCEEVWGAPLSSTYTAGEVGAIAYQCLEEGRWHIQSENAIVEVLDAAGRPVERAVLQATRDSWFTFRGKDSSQSDDFRLHNWTEMELDEFLYAGGEVVRLWLYPRGPDSGFKVYPGSGTRHTFFDTTAVTHALGEPAWIVRPLPPGAAPAPNGLPVFRLPCANDDAAHRRFGTDSLLLFEPPADGDYLARVSDVRGFGAGAAPDEWRYTLEIRPPRPGFTASLGARDLAVSPGGAREFPVSVVRDEGFEGPVRIEVTSLPPGFTFHGPLEIEAGQERAIGLLSAAAGTADPGADADGAVRVRAVATIGGREVAQDLGTLGDVKLGGPPKVGVEILDAAGRGRAAPEEPLRFRIRQGETIPARVRTVRHDFAERIELGGDDCGRNLPFGCYVDNIGLNGLLVVEGQTERGFVITASPVARPGRRLFHLRATADGGQASLPAEIEVVPAGDAAAR